MGEGCCCRVTSLLFSSLVPTAFSPLSPGLVPVLEDRAGSFAGLTLDLLSTLMDTWLQKVPREQAGWRLGSRVDEWMAKEGLLDPNVKSIFVTCGDWDLKVMLPGQCQYLGLPVADYFKQWINLKKAYSFAMGCWPKNGLLDMNKGLSLQHIGRPHSGIGDPALLGATPLGVLPSPSSVSAQKTSLGPS
uniref:ERI1 exoribonuclease family member 3 n=1 Tax=Bos mutus grunniens TaxID=30521 RepID=A0A8B9WJZ8_BOSMU